MWIRAKGGGVKRLSTKCEKFTFFFTLTYKKLDRLNYITKNIFTKYSIKKVIIIYKNI